MALKWLSVCIEDIDDMKFTSMKSPVAKRISFVRSMKNPLACLYAFCSAFSRQLKRL